MPQLSAGSAKSQMNFSPAFAPATGHMGHFLAALIGEMRVNMARIWQFYLWTYSLKLPYPLI